MQRLAKVRRILSDQVIRKAAVNPAQVQSVEEDPIGTYIAFVHVSEDDKTVPIGIKSPDTMEEVIKRLEKPYWHNLGLQIAALLLSAILVIVAILFEPA